MNKDGLFSAYVTASTLSRAILHEGVSEQALERGYGKAVRWLAEDNRYGRIVFGISRVAFAWPWVSRVMYQSLATEFKRRDEDKRPLGSVMWKIASGAADYREILREMFSFPAIRAFMVGTAVTLRNVAFELLFGLKWGKNGRYPTVVLREKREVVKRWLASSLGEEVDGSPGFERMYVIKIRGSRDRIAGELAKFGSREAKFLNLRFVSVRHIGGEPNEVGSVIQYRVPLIGLATEMRLARKAGPGTFLYRLDESLADRGKLIFDIAPTKDGNSKLSIYAAFDYKKGTTLTGRVFWYSARALFPEFVHDVVWNHALCTIKEEIEKKSRPAAFLVFLPRAARARVVPADLVVLVDYRRPFLLLALGRCRVAPLPLLPFHLLLFLADLRLQKHQVPDNLFFDPVEKRFEGHESLFLVFDEGVPLAVSSQADALLEVVHVQEVVLPLVVDHLQHHELLVLAHQALAQPRLLLAVFVLDSLFCLLLEDVGRNLSLNGRNDRF